MNDAHGGRMLGFRRQRSTTRSRPRPAEYAAALFAALVVAGGLAFEAYDAARSHRKTAERALQEYAGFAAREYARRVEERIRSTATPLLAPLVGARASTPFERLPPPSVMANAAGGVLTCPDPARQASRAFLRIDFRDGSIATAGAPLPPAERAQLSEMISAHARTAYLPDWPAALVLDDGDPSRAIIYGVKYAEHGAPIAAYAFTTCVAALRPQLGAAAASPLLPPSATRGTSADSLLSLGVRTPRGDTVYASAARYVSPFGADVVLPVAGRLEASVTLHPDAVNRVVIGPLPRSVIPEVIILLALTGALLLLASVQLRREQELARIRADFTSSVSHELRTPLAQIMLFAETLQLDRVRSDRERRQAVDVILQEARRLLHLVENVLQVSRAERRLTRLRRETRVLAPLIAEAVDAFARITGSADVCVHTRVDAALVADVDPWALRQMLLNLLDNAEKYGPPGQTIVVTAGTRGDRVLLHVDDEGPGIPPSDRERVFEPFVRLDGTGAGKPGSGIGLAVVRELAELHGGSARADSGPRGGARLTIELPRVGESVGGEPDEQARWLGVPSSNGDHVHAAHPADRG